MVRRNPIDAPMALVPLIPPTILLVQLIDNPITTVQKWLLHWNEQIPGETPSVGSQLLAYLIMAVFGYMATFRMVPSIQSYTLRKGIHGKDLGKKGTPLEDNDIPEALGIVPGAVFLVCLIFCLVGFAVTHPTRLLDVNSALLSICFMLFLGFTDDVLDWPWRYKLFLPSVASLPLLCCYNGSTSVVVPIQVRPLLYRFAAPTPLSHFLSYFVTIDSRSQGSLINLGNFYLLYMGMLAVFCTNAINIFAGINGLEAGQAYIIGCAVLFHNLLEIGSGHEDLKENHLFSVMLMMSFVGVTLGLLRHNWYPASVFVGDTYCYFAGMTFAVVGILGHFSKTLLLFFIPQVINFLYSTPQLFKIAPCPRHRLPRFDATTGLLRPSTFPCQSHQYRWLKPFPDDTEAPNMTVPNLFLQLLGPMSERTLCITLLAFQCICCSCGLWCRYYAALYFFDE